MPQDAPPNGSALGPAPQGPWSRVAGMQAKLHHWAAADPGRRFDDLFNFVHDPATLIVAFDRVAGNRGANTPGVDGWTVALVEERIGVPGYLDDLRAALKDGSFRPLPVRERKIPKPGGSGKLRKLGIPAVADKVVQAALKLVLEPIFEADFEPVSYGFRPVRRAHDAIAEIHQLGTRGYRWVLDADIEAAFDNCSHSAVMERVRARVKDKRVLALVKAFLKAGVLTELGESRDTHTGTPQGGILSPLIFNVVMPALDEHLHRPWKTGGAMATSSLRARRRAKGLPNWRVVRYADDAAGAAAVRGQDPHRAHGRGVRLPRVPHPVETQERHGQVARLHLHRRPAHPVAEGQDPCPDEQDVAAGPQVRADPAQSDHARLGQLLQARGLQAHPGQPGPLRLVAGDPVAQDAAPLEVEGRPPGLHHPRRAVEAGHGRRDRAVQPGDGAGHPVPLPRQHHPQPLGPQPRLTAGTVESPVPGDGHAGFGERPGETGQE
jgi:group II intron reverse transcriptase/maturase